MLFTKLDDLHASMALLAGNGPLRPWAATKSEEWRNGRSIDPLPEKRRFKNEDEEREHWAEHDSTEQVDWSKAERVTLPNLKPSVKSISLRLPKAMLEQLRVLASKRDVPHQSLIKLYLADRIRQEIDEDAA